ncbi:hypothetical protein ACFWD7_57405 [Streptomyces mirabilis]|uniref:hypothetical protein n=1 Tax=Streptomyces mirabilis TaxID=68239 RepID=UPI0036A24EA4
MVGDFEEREVGGDLVGGGFPFTAVRFPPQGEASRAQHTGGVDRCDDAPLRSSHLGGRLFCHLVFLPSAVATG